MAINPFNNPLLEESNADVPSLVTPLTASARGGLAGLGPSMADLAVTGERLIQGTTFKPAPTLASAAYFSPSRREIFRKGLTFTADDAARALEAEQLPQRDIAPPSGGDWVPLDETAYGQYVQSITQPTLGRLASKSFGRGVDISQALAGRALQLAGAEELGGRIVSAQEEDLRKTSPFERQFTDIESGRDAVEWFVANFAQQGPNLIESVVTAGIGFLAGTATGGPLAGAGGALAGLMGKTAFKESVKAAAKKKAAGEVLTAAENKLLREAAGIAGAVTASYTQNLATGAADIYGELRDSGANADDIDARIKAIAGSVPYAALETLPEYLLASRILGGARAPTAIAAGTTIRRRGAELLRRGAVGFGVGGLAEGTTEAGQEALLLGLAEKPLTGDEAVNRLVNSFAAGFGIGGPIGGVANLRGNKPANLLAPGKATEPTSTQQEVTPTPPQGPPQLPLGAAPGTQGDLFGGVGPVSPLPGLAPLAAGIPGVVGAFTPVGAGITPATEVPVTQQDMFATGPVQGQLFGAPPAFVGPQGLPAAVTPPVGPALGVIPGQMPLQFAPPAPTGLRFTGEQPVPETQISQQLQALQRQQEFEQAVAQRRAAEEAQAEAQRQLQMVPAEPVTQLPTPRQAFPAEPQQLPLFGARALPRPSGAERLRRGATPLPEPQEVIPPTPRELERAGQMRLFTRKGEPTVAALKGAGKRRPLKPQAEPGARQRPSEPAAKIREVAERVRKRQRVDAETPDGGRFVGLIDNEANFISGKYTYSDGSVFEGSFRDNAPFNGQYVDAEKAEYKITKGDMQLTKEAPGAVQEREAEEVSAREPAETGAGVGEEVPAKRAAAGKGAALRKGKAEEKVSKGVEEKPLRKVKEERPTPPKKEKPVYETPDEAWEDMKPDEAPRLTDLSPVQQAEWIVLYETNQLNQASAADILKSRTRVVVGERGRVDQLTKKIREEKRAAPPETQDQEEVDTLIETIETTKSKLAYKDAITALLDWLYTADANAKRAGLDAKAYEFLDSLPIDNSFREALVDFARTFKTTAKRDAEEGAKVSGKLRATYDRGDVKDQYTPVFKLILKAGMLDPIRKKFGFDRLPADMQLADETEPTDLPEASRLENEEDTEVGNEWDKEDGAFFRDNGQPIRKPVDIGRIRMLVSQFVNKLYAKPRIFIFRNQADLKVKDPELYAQAVAARPQGDFDTASAVGYSFGGNNVIIFSDRVRTDQQLNFVLAHESVGHLGFRALVPQNKFDALMNQVYDLSPAIRNGVDAAMEARGLPKAEAVEEYLADFAAELDVSLVARIWNVIKGALNKLGVKFGDEAARYFVDQSRRYVRNGDMSAFFTVQSMISRLQAIENGYDPDNTGRFAEARTLRDVNILAGGLMSDNALPQTFEEAVAYLKGKNVNFGGSFDSFKAKFFSLLAFRARENAGLDQLEKIMNEGRDISMSIKVAMKERMAVLFNRAITDAAAGFKFIGGTTEEQLANVNKFLYDGMRLAISKFDAKKMGSARLYTVKEDGTLQANETEINRLYDMGLLTLEQMRDGFTYEVTFEKEGKTVKEPVKVEGIAGLTEESVEWKGYLAARETMKDVELRLLKARYLAYTQERDLSFRELTEFLSDKGKTEEGKMSASTRQFLNRMYRKYQELWVEDQKIDANGDVQFNEDSIKRANDFVVALNTAIIATEASATDKVAAERNAKVAEFFPKSSPETINKEIETFKEGFVSNEESKFAIQNQLKNLIIAELGNEQADAFTKQTLATGYVPLLRRGQYEVRVQAFDAKGNPVVIKQDYKDQLAYRQFEDEAEALEIANQMNNDLFGDAKYQVEVLDRVSGEYKLQPVTLKAIPSVALDAVAAPPQLNLNEFTRGLRQFSIVLRPDKLEQVIVALTRQNNRARQRLMRRDVPGADPDAVRAVSEHVESRASTIAKVHMRPRISELMNLTLAESRKLWRGDKAELDRLKAEWDRVQADPNTNSAQREVAKRLYDRYAFMYNKTNPQDRANQGNKYFNEASGLLQFMENNRDLNESDFGAGEIASNVRAATSVMQLGGSIATGALNYIGALTNAIPFLATYNKESAFGGGFGFGASFREFMVALNQVGLVRSINDSRLNTAEYYDEIAASPQLQARYGLKDHEAKFIAAEIREGTMIPAQMNALTETARGRIKSAALQRGIEAFMWTFNATEQSSRRGVGLAAYRLEYNRRKAAGLSDDKASEFARQFAVDALKLSLGEYSVLNRPAAWRSGIQSFLYMYKVFPTTSIMLLSRLPRKGQIYMLASMLILAGVSGMPFAEDLEDLIDTIAQKLGFKSGSIRFEAAKIIDSMIPGASTLFISGASSYLLPADVAGRVSLGNFIPGTGILLAGANTGREAAEIGGPAWGMLSGTLESGLTGIKAATSEQVTFEDWLRSNPITAGRIFGDALAYSQSGAVVDRRGYVVSSDGNAAAIITRLLGFYPAAAANEYSIIRVSKRITDYQKEVTAGFRQGWIKAKIEGDNERARDIEEAVREWNRAAEGSGLEISNFVQNSTKALREARRPAKERLLRAAPKAAREDVEQVAELLGY